MKNTINFKIDFQDRVLQWYDTNQRVLPWRESRDPYHIWISEIMLQQTRVETVIPYYYRFIETLPNVQSLAETNDEVLYKLWEGLGYYSRVRNLKKAANQVLTDFEGVIPSDRKSLETLSGIGPYTSGAISSIAFGKKNAAVDGNVLRIFARLYEIHKSIKDLSVKKDIKEKVEKLLPSSRVGDFNQGLMEIGATVCLPNGKPKCVICPLKEICKAYMSDVTDKIPVRLKSKKVPVKKKTVLILRYNDLLAIEKRPDTGLLRSMYQFPMFEGHMKLDDIKKLHIDASIIKKLQKSTHKFSHLKWDIIAYEISIKNVVDGYNFVTLKDLLHKYSLPSAFKIYREHLMK